jgi:ABC-type hemin transport system substrate-binding protein
MATQRMIRNEARRIVCLTASLTEIIYALGLADRLAGVTDTCDYPQSAETKPNVGCWFEPDVAKLLALEPDLVLWSAAAHGRLRPDLEAKGIQVMLADPCLAKDPEWRRLQAVQAGRLCQFDCGLTCRTGPRIVDMATVV